MKERVQNWLKEAKWDLENANIFLKIRDTAQQFFILSKHPKKQLKHYYFIEI